MTSRFSWTIFFAFACLGWLLLPIVCLLAGEAIPWAWCAALGLFAGAAFGWDNLPGAVR